MSTLFSENAGTLWQKPSWYRALPLAERRASLQACMDAQTIQDEERLEKARKIFQQWKMQAPYNKGLPFAERLAVDALTENDLLLLLAEPCEALQARLLPPDWLLELNAAFEDASAWIDCPLPIQSSTGSEPASAFLNAIRPLLNRGIQRLIAGIHEMAQQYAYLPFDQQTVVPLLFANLSQQLLPQASRTFVLEMKVARTLGRLQGNTPEERFEHFVQQLSVTESILPFLEEYAVLTRQFMLTIDQWVVFSLELLRHVCADWEEMRAIFTPETDPGSLVEIHTGAGDTHRGGRSVAILTFHTGFQVVYKPRSLAIDLHFQELLRWLNSHGSHPPFQTSQMIDKGTYGWSAFIETRACESKEEVQRFYERQGAYLALLHVLDAADLHAENIIAMGEHPLLIDVEALFHPHIEMEHVRSGNDPAFAALNQSVMHVGLLPQPVWGNEDAKGINIGGLGGEEGQMLPRSVPQWEGAGTDQMRQVRAWVEMATSQNRPTLKGRSVNVLDYQEHILTGFTGMYQTLISQREALLTEMLPRFAQDEIRFIARSTHIYGRLLSDSFRPELLRDALERERHFDRLWIGVEWQPYMARLIWAERADLLRGDIPLFTASPDSRNLYTSQGEVVPAFFPRTSMDLVRKRLVQLGDQDLTRQRWIINASFTCVEMDRRGDLAQPCSAQSQPSTLTRSRYLIAARAIGDELCRRAIYDQGSAGWLQIGQVNEREWKIQAAGLDLYNGLPGIILFLAYLAKLTDEARYLDLARAALHNIPALLQHPQRQQLLSCIGAFEGWGGLIYLFTQLGVLWKEPALLQEAQGLVKLLQGLIEQDEAFDIMAGSAGCIVALLRLHTVVPSISTLETAIACGDHLLAHACPMPAGIGWKQRKQALPLTGMSHGNAGIAFSLLNLAESSGAERFRQAAFAALVYERGLFSPEQQNWPDLRKNNENIRLPQSSVKLEKHFMTAWCHGAPGIALARLASLRFLAEEMTFAELGHALATTITESEKAWTDPTLCHGATGLLETLLTAQQLLPHSEAMDYTLHIERLAHRLLGVWEARTLQDEVQKAPWWMEASGFMMGLAGIGYTLLRLADPLHVPSVLTLADPCSLP